MIKKYEIITVEGKKRIKALRSFSVQGRYVNVGDVGGIVYDENTLSQEGNAWIFSGNLNYPSIRVSGDSIVDTNGYEADVTDPRPFVNITGASALIGAHDFVSSAHSFGARIDINDSRIEFQYTSTMTVATKVNPSSASPTAEGFKSSVSASTLTINKSGGGNGIMWVFADIDHCNVTVSKLTTLSIITGTFKNVKRLLLNGTLAWGDPSAAVRAAFNFTDCDTVAYTNEVFPTTTITTVVSANTPFIFTRCNVPNGIFYHNAQAKNIYTDIDFAKASVDLGKTIPGTDYLLVSSEVEGMCRVYHVASKKFGALVESYDSVKDADFSDLATMVATTIYKDAKLTGLFNISGTNVFGGTGNHGGGKGCEIINTKETAAVIAGNVRVEGNATVKDVSITGTGYFGGDSVTEAPAALAAPMSIEGMVYMGDKAVFKPGTVNASAGLTILEMRDNAVFNGALSAASTFFNVSMFNSAIFSGALNARNGFVMRGNSYVASGAVIASACRGLLVLKDKARVEAGTLTAVGAITLEGTYKQTSGKTWKGNRTISSENEPTYDNNVKTKYDF